MVSHVSRGGTMGQPTAPKPHQMTSRHMDYAYHLDTSSRKYICPKCGRKTFVLYLDAANNPLSEGCGKCDRKDNCNYHYTPGDFKRDGGSIVSTRNTRKTYERPEPPSYIDPGDLMASMKRYDLNSLVIYLHKVFDGLIGSRAVEEVAISMGVGTSRRFGGSPIFWLIDRLGNIRDGKIMGYDSETGKRIKKPWPLITNVHSILKDKYQGTFKGCYFGSHQLKMSGNGNIPVWLFESEKAALIASMALKYGGCQLGLPMASGGCEAFNTSPKKLIDSYDRIRALKGRGVVLYPDKGKFDEWREMAKGLRGFSSYVYISDTLETSEEAEEGDGFDDLILRYADSGRDMAGLILESYGQRIF